MPTDFDRRREERVDCLIEARVQSADNSFLRCVVRDISTTGVRLQIDPQTDVPTEFILLVPEVPGVEQKFLVRRIWRDGPVLGGEFIKS